MYIYYMGEEFIYRNSWLWILCVAVLLTMGIVSCSSNSRNDEDFDKISSSGGEQLTNSSSGALSSNSGGSSPSGATSSSSEAIAIIDVFCKVGIYCLEMPSSWCSSQRGTVVSSCESSSFVIDLVYCHVGNICYNKKIPFDLCLELLKGKEVTNCGGGPDPNTECGDPITQFCVDGNAYDKCGGKLYKPGTEKCVGGWIVSKDINCPSFNNTNSFCDEREGVVYEQVTIGTQTWMARNLNFSYKNTLGSCYQEDSANCSSYGRLYDWSTAAKVCPEGWHLPTQDEWTTLVNYAGQNNAGAKLKATSGWNDNGNGTSEGNLGFNALPGGFYGPLDGSTNYHNKGKAANFWSSSADSNPDNGVGRYMGSWGDVVDKHTDPKSSRQSVRCVKNPAGN